MKPYKKKWNINYRQAISIDWHKAYNEIENKQLECLSEAMKCRACQEVTAWSFS